MTVDEILVSYRQSKNKGQQVVILSQLNSCATWEIVWVLVENGIDPRSFNKVASLRNAYEKAKEKGLQLPAKKISDINAEITPEEAPEQNPEPDEKVVIIPETENETVTIKPDQSEVEPEQDEEPQISEEAVMLESYEKTIETLNNEIAYLQEKNKEYLEKIQELHKSLEHHKVSDFNATTDSMQKELEIKKLKESIAFYSDEREGDGLTIAALKHENEELKTKVTAAEQYILNMLVYGNPFA